jgi:hypothetical protein
MRRLLVSLGIILLSAQVCFGAWDTAVPADNQTLKSTPALIRANWVEIQNGTNANLLVTNDKVSPTAAIVDTKLGVIQTAGKVNATSFAYLGNTPSGAGVLPVANGGTGGSTAALARAALSAAMLGNNTDITRLNNLTTPLSIAQGGTGSASQNFVGLTANQTINGTKEFLVIPLLPASAPTLSTQAVNKAYVDNMTANNTQLFTTNGTFNTPANVNYVFVSMTGAGGGGAGADQGVAGGGGGGSGAYVTRVGVPVNTSENYTVTVGAKGLGGVAENDGTNGTSSIFYFSNGNITCDGGKRAIAKDGGLGGVGAGNYSGQAAPANVGGVAGTYVTTSGFIGGVGALHATGGSSGGGASNPFGLGTAGGDITHNITANCSIGYGGGGGGGTEFYDSYAGGNGAGGVVYLEW